MIKVDVSGPGGTFSFEAERIRRTLEQAGFKVDVTYSSIPYTFQDMVDQVNHGQDVPLTADQYYEQLERECVKLDRPLAAVQMTISNHPWGG